MTPPAAPFLTAADLCSDCKVKPVTLDRGAMRVCPNCFALLWHANSGTEESRRAAARKLLVDRAEAASRERTRRAELRTAMRLGLAINKDEP